MANTISGALDGVGARPSAATMRRNAAASASTSRLHDAVAARTGASARSRRRRLGQPLAALPVARAAARVTRWRPRALLPHTARNQKPCGFRVAVRRLQARRQLPAVAGAQLGGQRTLGDRSRRPPPQALNTNPAARGTPARRRGWPADLEAKAPADTHPRCGRPADAAGQQITPFQRRRQPFRPAAQPASRLLPPAASARPATAPTRRAPARQAARAAAAPAGWRRMHPIDHSRACCGCGYYPSSAPRQQPGQRGSLPRPAGGRAAKDGPVLRH